MNRIKELREEKKITQVRLSIELEVSQETISAYEKGKYSPSVKSLIRLREIFGVPIDYILVISNVKHECVQITDLTQDETCVINLYKSLDIYGKKRVQAYMEGYLAALSRQ